MAKTGRPTAYKPEYADLLLAYFEKNARAMTLPHLSKWARTVAGVCHDTAIEWTKVHPEFSEAYKKAKDIQKEVLIEGALTGKFQQTFAIFTAKNITDMRDVQETKNQTDVHVTGFENLSDYELHAVITKLQNTTTSAIGQSFDGESEESGAEPVKVRISA